MCKILRARFLYVNPPLLCAIYMGHIQMLQFPWPELKPLNEQFPPLIMYNSAMHLRFKPTNHDRSVTSNLSKNSPNL